MRSLSLLLAWASAWAPQADPAPNRIEWDWVVPLGTDPDIVARLAGADGEAAVAAYETILRGRPEYWPRGTAWLWALDLKALRDGAPLLKRRVLSVLEIRDVGSSRAAVILDALLTLDPERAPLRPEDLGTFPSTVLMSVRPEHAERIRSLANRPESSLKILSRYGLAVLGDAEALRTASEDFRSTEDWRLGASARVLARAPESGAIPKVQEFLRSRDRPKLRAAFAALPGYPGIDVTRELSDLLEYDDPEIQTLTLRAITARRIDLSERAMALYSSGKIKVIMGECGSSPPPPFVPTSELGLPLFASDNPNLLGWLSNPDNESAGSHAGLVANHWSQAPPKLRERLKGLAAGREGPGKLATIGSAYLEDRLKASESVDEVLDLLQSCGHRKHFPYLHTALFYADPETQAQKDRLFAMCRGWLGKEGHPLRFAAGLVLHRWGAKEADEDLLLAARSGGQEGMKCLSVLGITPETRPMFLEQFKGPDPFSAMSMLARARDEVVIPQVLEGFKSGKFPYVGGNGGLAGLLKNFPDKDFSDDLLAGLDKTTHQAHVVSILSYLRWRGRKDKAELMRSYLTHPYGLVVLEAAGALGDWKDEESIEILERLVAKRDSDHAPWLLHAMMGIDPERARPYFEKRLPGLIQLEKLSYFGDRFPKPQDLHLVRRILQAHPGASIPLARISGNMYGREIADALLILAEDGSVEAATGLAYTVDPRGIDVLCSRIDAATAVGVLNALDTLVNAGKQPAPGLTRRFTPGPRSGDEAAKQVQEAFGVEIGFAGFIPPREVTFEAVQDFVGSLERIGAGRYPRAHITREGRIDFVPLAKARAHWMAWRAGPKK